MASKFHFLLCASRIFCLMFYIFLLAGAASAGTIYWVTKAPVPTARAYPVSAVVNGKVYVLGGVTEAGFPPSGFLDTVEMYDPAADTWQSKPPLSISRALGCAVAQGNYIYIIGGGSNAGPGWGPPVSTTVLRYDTTNGASSVIGNITIPRMRNSCEIINNKIYIIGGSSCGGPPSFGCAINSMEVFDLGTGTVEMVTLPVPMDLPVTATDGVQNISLGGGFQDGNPVAQNSAWIYDTLAEAFYPISPMLVGRGGGRGAMFSDGKGYMSGGLMVSPPSVSNVSTVMQKYDPVDNNWTPVSGEPLPVAAFMRSIAIANDCFYVAGGSDENDNAINTNLVDCLRPSLDSLAIVTGAGNVSTSGVTLSLPPGTGSGLMAVSTSDYGPALPPGSVAGQYYDIATSADFTGSVTVTIPYDSSLGLTDIGLYHWNGSTWENITTSIDTINHTVTGLSSSLSPFVAAASGGGIPDLLQSWRQIYDSGFQDTTSAMAVDGSGNVYVTGFFFNGSTYDAITTKYDSSGTEQWSRVYSTANDDVGNGITVDGSGNVYITGDSCSTTSCACFILKYNSSGTPVSPWNPKKPTGMGRCSDIKLDISNNVYVAGPYRSSPSAEPDFRLLKLNQTGTVLCSRTYDRGFGYFDYAHALALDSSNSYIYVTGESYNGSNHDYLTLKYSSSSGCPLVWARIYDSGGSDVPNDMAVYGNNQIFITGYTGTIKYDSSGNLLITAPFTGNGVSVDESGYVYLAGWSGITKVTGSLNEIWNSPQSNIPNKIAVDSDGYLYITGTSYTGPNPNNIFTAKYQQVPLSILTSALSPGTVGIPYSQTLEADGGISPYSWSVSGSLPNGLTLNSFTGEIAGTPTSSGTFGFTVQLTDYASKSISKSFSITMSTPLTIVTSSPLPDGMIGRSYNKNLTASGGEPGYSWHTNSASLPNGLSLSSSGALSGTPTVTGTFGFTVYATDTGSQSTQKEFLITIHENLLITAVSLPSGTAGTPYTPTMPAAMGGKAPYAWSGNLPDGLTINSSTGEISGTPKTPGTYTVTLQVKDANDYASMTQSIVTIDPLSCQASAVRIDRTHVLYDTIRAAYKTSQNEDVLQAQALSLLGLDFDSNVLITLKGGYDCNFADNAWNTAITGPITIIAGTVTIENIVLQ